jgi:hypothetical protein
MSRSYTSSPPSATMACSGTALFRLICFHLYLPFNHSIVKYVADLDFLNFEAKCMIMLLHVTNEKDEDRRYVPPKCW